MTNSDRRNFIYFIVNEKQEKMSRIVNSVEKSTKRFRKACKLLNIVSTTSGSIAVAATSASLATALTGVGIVVSVPLSIVSGILASIGVVGSAVNDRLHKMLDHKEVLLNMSIAYKISLEEQIGLALKDEAIDGEEYTKILAIYKDFIDKSTCVRTKTKKQELWNNLYESESDRRDRMKSLIDNRVPGSAPPVEDVKA